MSSFLSWKEFWKAARAAAKAKKKKNEGESSSQSPFEVLYASCDKGFGNGENEKRPSTSSSLLLQHTPMHQATKIQRRTFALSVFKTLFTFFNM